MSVPYLLDTDHVTLFQHRHPLVVQRVLEHAPELIAVTAITLEEQLQGRLAIIQRASQELDVVRGYARLSEPVAFFQAISIVLYSEDAATLFQAFRRQGIRIGTKDLRIAAIARSIDAIVVTRNRRDFERVPDLLIEDWSL